VPAPSGGAHPCRGVPLPVYYQCRVQYTMAAVRMMTECVVDAFHSDHV